ncbi:hypothetical protein FB645_001254 [Coemansia sp. IMI 203386]|nr:hypothetical protein FB645_001254 [Coemansia sp. IMI 203386]
MADIEQEILGQGGGYRDGDEDETERARACENSDHSATDDESAKNNRNELTMATGFHDGPQTGVKGVLADYRNSQRQQRHQREQQKANERAAYQAAASKSIVDNSDRTIWTKDDDQLQNAVSYSNADLKSGSDSDLDDLDKLGSDEEDERLFAEYRDRRMAELRRVAEKRGLGVLRDATPEEYVDIVEQQADSGNCVAVVLVDQGFLSQRFVSCVDAEAANFGQTVFLRVSADECGFCDADVIPIMLVYRTGQLKHNLVRVVDQFADPRNFEQQDVGRLLKTFLLK